MYAENTACSYIHCNFFLLLIFDNLSMFVLAPLFSLKDIESGFHFFDIPNFLFLSCKFVFSCIMSIIPFGRSFFPISRLVCLQPILRLPKMHLFLSLEFIALVLYDSWQTQTYNYGQKQNKTLQDIHTIQ